MRIKNLKFTAFQKTYFIAIALFLLALIKTIYFSRLGFGLLDEGENLHNGLRILNGDLPYRDFYTLLPPLDNYWAAISFKMFGVSIFSPRLLSSMVFSVLPVIFFLIARKSLRTFYALIPAVLIIFMDLNIERIYYCSFIFGGFLLFIYSLDKKSFRWKILAGLLLGVGSLVRLDYAGGFLVGIFVGMICYTLTSIRHGKIIFFLKTQSLFWVGFVLVMLSLIFWLANYDLIALFSKAFFINALGVTHAYSLQFPALFEMVPQNLSPANLMNAYSAWFANIILLTYLVFGGYFLRNWSFIWRYHKELGLMFFVGLFISPYMFGRADLGHLVKGGIPFLFLGSFLLSETRKIRKDFVWVRYAFFLIPIIILVSNLVQSFWWVRFNDTKLVVGENVLLLNSYYPANSTLVSAQTIGLAVDFIKTHTKMNEPFLALPYMAGLYFLMDRPSQTYVDNVFVGFLPDENQFIKQLEYLKINVVIYDPVNGPQSKKKLLKSYYPQLDAYIMSRFDVVEQTNEGWLFMRRKNENF